MNYEFLTRFGLFLTLSIQIIECIYIFYNMNPNHPWHWNNLKNEFKTFPNWIFTAIDILFSRSFYLLITLHCGLILSVLWTSHILILCGLLFTCMLLLLRFRGVFNGGSDYMTIVLIIGLMINQITGHIQYGLFYIAIQSTLSYFVAGIVKLKNQQWLKGMALKNFLLYSNYPIPKFYRNLAKNNKLILLSTWIIILWECCFPLTLLNVQVLKATLIMGFLFHVINFLVFGLNRFVWTWLATYPSLFYLHSLTKTL